MAVKLTGKQDLISKRRRTIEVGEGMEGAKFRASFHELGNFRYLPPSAQELPISHPTITSVSIPLNICLFP